MEHGGGAFLLRRSPAEIFVLQGMSGMIYLRQRNKVAVPMNFSDQSYSGAKFITTAIIWTKVSNPFD